MFDFLSMMDNYEDRRVGRYEDGNIFVSTAMVTDSTMPYETALAHPSYNDGDIVIVEKYNDEQVAKKGHERWVELVKADDLPDPLIDVGEAGIALLLDMVSDVANEGSGWRFYWRNGENSND